LEQRAQSQILEQAAQADRITIMYASAEQQIFSLEHVVKETKAKAEESSQLLSGSVSVVYALEGETSRLQQTINMRCEEITQLTRTNEEMQQSWTTTMNANVSLRAQLSLAESSFNAEQRDASTRLQEDVRLRNELSMCLSCETSLEAGATISKIPYTIGDSRITE
jgi:predicted  nucleic acid-binding Zn-ribbon protein